MISSAFRSSSFRLSLFGTALALSFASGACGGDEAKTGLVCGEGTSERDGKCVVASGGSGGGSAGANAGGGTAGAGGTTAGGKAGGAGVSGSSGLAGAAGVGGASGGAGAGAAGAAGSAQAGAPGVAGAAGSSGAAGKSGADTQKPAFAGVAAVAPSSSTSLFIAWKPATDETSPSARISYRIFIATKAGGQDFGKPTAVAPPGATSAELFVGITSNTTYFVVVRAFDEAGNADDNVTEKTATTATDKVAPVFAGAASATTAGPAAVTVSWAPAKDDLTPPEGIVYYVYGSQVSGKKVLENLLAVSEPGATSFLVKNLPDADKPTFFAVRARDGAGNVDTNVKEVSALPGKDVTPPSFAGCSGAVTNNGGGIDVLWDPAADDGTAPADLIYEVWASTVPELQDFGAPPNGSSVGGSAVTITGLAPSTDYYVVCRARDASGNQDKNLSQKSARTPADAEPPTFLGLSGISEVSTTSLRLTWAPATDNVNDPADLVYDVYQAEKAGAESFAVPTKTSAPGAVSTVIDGLGTSQRYYFVVRARDKSGNQEKNVVEQSVTTAVSFKLDVQPILSTSCATDGCHSTNNAQSGLVLSPGFAFGNLVNVPSSQAAPDERVVPGSPDASYFFRKIINAPGIVGGVMPPGGLTPLTEAQLSTINAWISEGAANN